MTRDASGVPVTIHPARSAENPKHFVLDDQLMQLGATKHAGDTRASASCEKQ